MKKILAVLLAALFVVSMSTMAFAENITGTIDTKPSKTDYVEGETVNLAGLVIKYGEDKKATYSAETASKFTPNPAEVAKGTTKVTVTYDDGTDKVTVSFNVTVNAKPNLEALAIAQDPAKKGFEYGQDLNLAGLKITYTDKDGKQTDVTYGPNSGIGFTGYDKYKAGEQKVTITYKGLSKEIIVTVAAKPEETTPTLIEALNSVRTSGLKDADLAWAYAEVISRYAEDVDAITARQKLVQSSSLYPDNWNEFVKVFTDYIPTAVNQQLDIAARLGWDASDQDFVQDVIDLVKGAAESDKAADKAADNAASTDANPKTGSASAIAVFAVLSVAAAAVVCTKKKED